MRHPGSNILRIASRVIRTQRVTWHHAVSRSEDARGRWMTLYAPPAIVRGSWQPINRARYEALGLDLKRKYAYFFTSAPVLGIDEGRSPDMVDYHGRRHEVVDVQPWDYEDGWRQVMVVEIGDTSEVLPVPEVPDP